MRTLVESFNMFTAAIVVAVLSFGLVWLLCSKVSVRLGAVWAVIVPLVIAYSLYWSPVWLGAESGGYSTWEFMIVLWFFAGFFPSAFLVLILQRRSAKLQAERISQNNPPN